MAPFSTLIATVLEAGGRVLSATPLTISFLHPTRGVRVALPTASPAASYLDANSTAHTSPPAAPPLAPSIAVRTAPHLAALKTAVVAVAPLTVAAYNRISNHLLVRLANAGFFGCCAPWLRFAPDLHLPPFVLDFHIGLRLLLIL